MPSKLHREIKRQIYRALDPYPPKPIECDGPFYVELFEGQHDPIAQIEEKIDLSGVDSMQFLSGCRGTGKTTELNRLRHRLEEANYIVFHADALEYLNPGQPIEINELLVVLTAAFSEQIAGTIGRNPAREGYLQRFWNYLSHTTIQPEEFGLKAGVSTFEADFKATLRTTETFRQKIGSALAGRTQEIKNQSAQFIAEAVQWLKDDHPGSAGIVFLFDSLEQLRGSTTNESDVMSSVERVFTQHRELLRLEEVHVVYTVPPWLRYRAPGAVHLEKMLPCVKLWQYGSEDHMPAASVPGWSTMRELITKRVGEDQMSYVFGPPDSEGNYPPLDTLIQHCGGHFRDLLMLVGNALVAAEEIEINASAVEVAISNLRNQFPIAQNEAEWLRQIHETQLDCLPDSDPKTVSRFTRMLDHHLVLLFANGRDWYDVHPIILEDVLLLSDQLRADTARAQAAAATPLPGI